jgi:predicted branched-subunit amino acid permease
MIGATVPQGVGWIFGIAIGAVSGDFIGDPERLGLDVIFPAFFLVLLAEELRGSRRAVAVALIAASLALALVPFAPAGVPVIAACVAALLGLRGQS